MITVIALVLQVLVSVIRPTNVWTLTYYEGEFAPVVIDQRDDKVIATPESTVYADAYDDAWCEFTNLFNSYNYKLSKNGRSMINGKFVKMGE